MTRKPNTALNDTTGETAKFLSALSQTMQETGASLEDLVGAITKANIRALFNNMAAQGVKATDETYDRLCAELFQRYV